MLGANVGTTLIVQALSFDVAAASPALILIGVLMFRRGAEAQTHDLGRVFIGLGLTLLALHQLLVLMTQYEDEPSLRLWLGAVASAPFLDMLLAAGVTWAAHSSVAIVLLAMSLAAQGVVPPMPRSRSCSGPIWGRRSIRFSKARPDATSRGGGWRSAIL